MKIPTMRAELFHVDGWTCRQMDRHDEIIGAFFFALFRKTPKNYTWPGIVRKNLNSLFAVFVTQAIFLNSTVVIIF